MEVKGELTEPKEQLSKTSCYEWAAFHCQPAPTMSIYCRSPDHLQMEFLSSSGKSDMLPDAQNIINQAM